MAVKLLSSGGGSVTLDVPSTASDFALTVPANSGTMAFTSDIVNASAIYFYGTVTDAGATFNSGVAIQYPSKKVSNGITVENSNSRFKINTAGVYLVVVTTGRYGDSGVTTPASYIRKNGTIVSGQSHPNAGSWTQSSGNCVISCAVNDYIEVTVDRDNCVLYDSSMLSIVRVGA